MIRTAEARDVEAIVRLTNLAFQVEAFFKIGDRTSAADVLKMMDKGEFFVLEDPAGTIVASVYLTVDVERVERGGRGYLGMLSVDPGRQGNGYGRRLIAFVESACAARGCQYLDIHIVNLREELPAFYTRLGYVERGTLPFSEPDRSSLACHFIVMTKELGATSRPQS